MDSNYGLGTSLILCYQLKENDSQAHRMLEEAHGEHALKGASSDVTYYQHSILVP